MWWGETVNYTYRYQICSGSTAILDDCLEKLGDGVPYKLCHNQNCWDLSKKCLCWSLFLIDWDLNWERLT